MKALVTGAGGFLGRRVVLGLLDRGHDVRAMVRPSANLDDSGWPAAVEPARADLTVDDLGPAFEGVDVLVHLAAAMRGTAREQHASTVGGTVRLLEAMARSRTRRLVLASSLSVYDWSATSGTLDEGSPLEADPARRDGYAAAKVEQERIVRLESSSRGWELTVLRPGFIWGRGQVDLPALGQKVGPLRLVIGPSTRPPLTHVDNCAHAFVVAAEDPRAIGRTFNVVDGEGPTTWGFLGEVGPKGPRLPIPYGLAFNVARLAQWASRTLLRDKVRLPGILVPCRFEARFKPLRFTDRKLVEGLGWAPPLDRAEQVRRAHGPESVGPSAVPESASNATTAVGEAAPGKVSS